MKKALAVIDNLQVASPCEADWDEMVGDDKTRHCQLCRKDVHDLTVMNDAEIASLVAKTRGEFCGRLWQRDDGKVLAEDCPVGVRAALSRGMRASGRFVALLFAALIGGAWFGCKSENSAATTPPETEACDSSYETVAETMADLSAAVAASGTAVTAQVANQSKSHASSSAPTIPTNKKSKRRKRKRPRKHQGRVRSHSVSSGLIHVRNPNVPPGLIAD